MGFEIPDYSYGLADSALQTLDYLLRIGAKGSDGTALEHVQAAREAVEAYKAAIYAQVMERPDPPDPPFLLAPSSPLSPRRPGCRTKPSPT